MTSLDTTQPIVLPRGGVIFPTSSGWIQYGAVPETIKDTMVLPDGVPQCFVVGPRLFSAERGISLAELEFPAYFNFFVRKRRTIVICRSKQRSLLEQVIGMSLFGPAQVDPIELQRTAADFMPDLGSEMAHFRRNPMMSDQPMMLEDLIELREFDEGSATAVAGDGTTVVLQDDGGIAILDRGRTRWQWPGEPPLPSRSPESQGQLKAFRGPLLGVSVIGSGHGFDPGNRTCGFIVWIQGNGVMVDPPVDWEDWLAGYDINPKQLDTLVLTHCHADHDAGALQKIMQEGRVTVYTTPTVLNGFVTKYSALTGVSPEALRDLFDHVPVYAGEPYYLHGAEATFRYSLHSIPCMGFELRLRNRSMVYPSDTMNKPEEILRLHEQGILGERRRDELLNFPWHHDLILHEAGIPPIHTPVEALAGLGEEIRKRMLLVHVSQKSIPEGSGLQVAPTGLDRTLDLSVQLLPDQEALATLDTMARVEIFAQLPVERACMFLQMASRRHFEPGQTIIEAGSPGDDFFIILSGLAGVWVDGKERKTFAAYDFFGEHAILLGTLRTAGVVAKTAVDVFCLTASQFRHLIRGTGIAERLTRLAHQRDRSSWELLAESPVFRGLTANQKNQIETFMVVCEHSPGELLGEHPVILEEGVVQVLAGGRPVARLERGGLAGDASSVLRASSSRFAFRAQTRVKGYALESPDFRAFLRHNPGAYLQLRELAIPWHEAMTGA
ncbi:MAG: cyclic nucleotide-binding domain-containing protein [Candidatus Wallbacteria bacterium]|nr:cyclic nucleotide-binding domain-containing protein [Candidatus Wallbacteria bacterium]